MNDINNKVMMLESHDEAQKLFAALVEKRGFMFALEIFAMAIGFEVGEHEDPDGMLSFFVTHLKLAFAEAKGSKTVDF